MPRKPKQPEVYDLEKVYDEQIAPLMTKIISICKRHRMPVVASFQYAFMDDAEAAKRGRDEGHDYCTTFIEFPGREPEAFRRAVSAIQNSGPSVLAMTIASKPGGT